MALGLEYNPQLLWCTITSTSTEVTLTPQTPENFLEGSLTTSLIGGPTPYRNAQETSLHFKFKR